MKLSQLVKDLQHKLSLLLENPVFAQVRLDRVVRIKGELEDALIHYNMAASEALRHQDASSMVGKVSEKKLDDFIKQIDLYMQKNGTLNHEYDNYVAIITQYLAFVVREPLHPTEVRHLENNPPKDSIHRRYCGWKSKHIKDPFSLCRFCNCLPWPAGPEKNHDLNERSDGRDKIRVGCDGISII